MIFSGELLYIWIGLCLIQCLIWLIFYFSFRKKTTLISTQKGVSVIICAKNAASDLNKYLPKVLGQDYTSFECIVVNDQSTDNTDDILAELKLKYSHLYFFNSNKPSVLTGKRYALKKGIEAAKYDQILLTDADCEPSSNQWIKQMMSESTAEKKIVLGLAPYVPNSTIINLFARYENLYSAINYISSARIGIPYMGVGRNILYSKEVLNWKILEDKNLSSGDDDLMVNDIATTTNTEVVIDAKSMCYSEAPSSWSDFFFQKQRHVSTGTYYQWKHWLWLNMINGSQSLVHLGSLFLVFLFPKIVLCLLFIRWAIMVLAYFRLMSNTQSLKLLLLIPIMDYCLSLYFLAIVPFVFIRKQGWK